jgi:uncharacterized protein YegL
MPSFQQAADDHSKVHQAALQDAELAEQVWLGVSGGEPMDRWSEAVAETLPAKHIGLLTDGGPPTAWAFARAWEVAQSAGQLNGFEARELARRLVWEPFCRKAEQVRPLKEGLGCDDSDGWDHERDYGSYDGDMDQVLRIAKLAGQMYAALKSQRGSTPTKVPQEIYDVETGGDIGRLVASELGLLGTPAELAMLQRVSERRALQWAMRGEPETPERGPLVICLDESGSMHNQRNVWAKAAAIALMRVALEDGRHCSVVHFSTSTRLTEVQTPADMIRVAKHFLSGGTRLGRALHRAAKQVEAMATKDAKPDVVLVSDGESHDRATQSDALDKLEAVGSKLWTVSIGQHSHGPTRDRATQYTMLGTVNTAEQAADALGAAVNPQGG